MTEQSSIPNISEKQGQHDAPAASSKLAQENLLGILLTSLGAMCWGLSGSMGQFLFQHEQMDSRWLVPIRLGGAGIVMLLFLLFKYGKQVLSPWKDRTERWELFIYSILGVSLCQFFYFLTIQLSNAAIGTILQDLAPLFILCFSCTTEHRKPKFLELFSIFLALFGVILIASHGKTENLAASAPALLAGILSALGAMIYNVAPVNLMKHHPVSLLQGWAFLLGGGFTALLFRPWNYSYLPSRTGIFGISFVILVGNIAAFICYLNGIKRIGPGRAILYSFAEPITAALIGIFLFRNPFTIADALGFLMIFGMLYLITVSGRKEIKEQA